jgi:antitoxin component HigA of HigAB toxin-antitoxin module
MKRVQIIEHDGKPAFAVVPIDLWERVREGIEDADAVAAYDRAVANDDGFTIPAAVLRAELDGSHPLRAWREHRGMTLQALADATRMSKPYVSQIEGGKRAGTAATLKKLAKVLQVPLDALQP